VSWGLALNAVLRGADPRHVAELYGVSADAIERQARRRRRSVRPPVARSLAVRCPYCGAPPEAFCTTASGQIIYHEQGSHRARTKAYARGGLM
jgi:hypothetical protein